MSLSSLALGFRASNIAMAQQMQLVPAMIPVSLHRNLPGNSHSDTLKFIKGSVPLFPLSSTFSSFLNYTHSVYDMISSFKLFHHDQPVEVTSNDTKVALPFVDYITSSCPSLSATYTPTPYLFNGHLQTIYSSFYKYQSPNVNYERYTNRPSVLGSLACEQRNTQPVFTLFLFLTIGSWSQ